jgi:hypothetical protein
VIACLLMFAGICCFGGIRTPGVSDEWAAWSVTGNGLGIAALVTIRAWDVTPIFVVFLIATLWRWNRRRKDPDKVSVIGAKARAVRDLLVRRARDATTPRQVLNPVPVR